MYVKFSCAKTTGVVEHQSVLKQNLGVLLEHEAVELDDYLTFLVRDQVRLPVLPCVLEAKSEVVKVVDEPTPQVRHHTPPNLSLLPIPTREILHLTRKDLKNNNTAVTNNKHIISYIIYLAQLEHYFVELGDQGQHVLFDEQAEHHRILVAVNSEKRLKYFFINYFTET